MQCDVRLNLKASERRTAWCFCRSPHRPPRGVCEWVQCRTRVCSASGMRVWDTHVTSPSGGGSGLRVVCECMRGVVVCDARLDAFFRGFTPARPTNGSSCGCSSPRRGSASATSMARSSRASCASRGRCARCHEITFRYRHEITRGGVRVAHTTYTESLPSLISNHIISTLERAASRPSKHAAPHHPPTSSKKIAAAAAAAWRL